MPDRVLREGRLLGNYRLKRLLGQGGFAEVYLGEHVHLDTLVAIKVLHAHLDATHMQKFSREARLVASLRHPHIITITDFGVQDEVPYLVMDYAPGGTLRQLVPKGSRVAPVRVLEYLTPIGEALDFAHREQVVHRDVKPENMLLGRQDKILLSDFGIATVVDRFKQATQTVAGTASYMAPEQLRGRPQPASDQYALAVVAYEWLCGARPFRGTFAEVVAQHLQNEPPPLSARNPAVPQALEEVILIALSKSPAQRFPSLGDFLHDFALALRPQRRAQQQTTPPARPVPPRTRSPVRHESPITVKQPTEHSQSGTPRRTMLAALGGLTLLGGGGAAWWLYTHNGSVVNSQSSTVTPGSTHATSLSKVANNSDNSPTVAPNGQTFYSYGEHTDIVYAVVWSPDGKFLVTGSRDKTEHLVNANTGKNIRVYREHADIVFCASWSPDSNYVASGSFDMTVKIWDINKNETVNTYSGLNRIISSVSWSSSGSRIATVAADSDEIKIYSSTDGTDIISYHVNATGIFSIAWSPDGNHVAVGCGGGSSASVQVWNVSTNSRTASYDGHTGGVFSIAWSPDGQLIASGGQDKTVQVWNVSTGENILTYSNHTDVVTTIAWSQHTKRIASGSNDSTVHVWADASGIDTFIYRNHIGNITSLTWSPDGTRIASASFDRTVKVWQAV